MISSLDQWVTFILGVLAKPINFTALSLGIHRAVRAKMVINHATEYSIDYLLKRGRPTSPFKFRFSLQARSPTVQFQGSRIENLNANSKS